MKQSLIENNNSFDKFNQIWPHYVFTEPIEETPPNLSLGKKEVLKNKDGTPYVKYSFAKKDDNGDHNHLVYLQNFELTKEYRQLNIWKLELNDDEESLRRIILPGVTVNRKYEVSFSDGDYEVPFNFVNPHIDFETCQLETEKSFDKLYINCWIYSDFTLADKMGDLPFDSSRWLLKDNKTGDKIRFEVSQEKVYVLPSDEFNLTETKDTIVTTNIFNQVLNALCDLDEGEYW